MNLSDLKLFAAAARLGSITKTAQELATVQSNVTARIRVLEEELGVQLFRRNHTGIVLTPKGQQLLPYAQQSMALIQKAKDTVSNQKETDGPLKIGSLQTTAAARLPQLLKSYVALYKNVDISIETGVAADLVEKLLNYTVEGVFVPEPTAIHPDLVTVPAFEEELLMVTPAAYRTVKDYLAKGKIPKVLVFKSGCYYRQQLEFYLSQTGINLLNEMEFGTVDGIIGCISAGLGITMLPKSFIDCSALRKEVRTHKLDKSISHVQIVFATRKAQLRSNALEGFLQLIAQNRH
ncbi:MAG TPA: LysR substrate-binding domain-containing protein [bacterium]|jgi:DNA-binding transcriptional LysR family regulator|nr:LysR substrate-binding domain-containing protein [bacterium]